MVEDRQKKDKEKKAIHGSTVAGNGSSRVCHWELLEFHQSVQLWMLLKGTFIFMIDNRSRFSTTSFDKRTNFYLFDLPVRTQVAVRQWVTVGGGPMRDSANMYALSSCRLRVIRKPDKVAYRVSKSTRKIAPRSQRRTEVEWCCMGFPLSLLCKDVLNEGQEEEEWSEDW